MDSHFYRVSGYELRVSGNNLQRFTRNPQRATRNKFIVASGSGKYIDLKTLKYQQVVIIIVSSWRFRRSSET